VVGEVGGDVVEEFIGGHGWVLVRLG
jgi:hypothetical protein